MYDFLTEKLLPIRTSGRQEWVALPELYRLLVRDEVDSFPGLAAHQAPALYQFLVQVGALAMQGDSAQEIMRTRSRWHSALAALTPGHSRSAWSLIEEDATRPAILQPPTQKISRYKALAETPDGLEILVSAKNHDRKRAMITSAAPHHWLYSLVTLQTYQGFSGNRLYGIARMNGGSSSRVLVDRRPNARWGARVVRALNMLQTRRSDVLSRVSDAIFRSEGGIGLVWLLPWDSDEQIELCDLDPYFVEICRRIRLVTAPNSGIAILRLPSRRSRIHAKHVKGNLGDPWVPVNIKKEGPSALTVSASGFDYRLAQRVLFDSEMQRPLSLEALPDEKLEDAEIHMAVLVRGQGKTEGFHERIIPLPREIAQLFASSDSDTVEAMRIRLADLSTQMVNLAGSVRRVLRQCVLVYLQGRENPNFRSLDATYAVNKFDRCVDDRFFRHLFDGAGTGDMDFGASWQRFLAEESIRQAKRVWLNSAPPRTRREKARSKSEAVLYGGLRRSVPEAFSRNQAA